MPGSTLQQRQLRQQQRQLQQAQRDASPEHGRELPARQDQEPRKAAPQQGAAAGQ
jgi:hypothetical protein